MFRPEMSLESDEEEILYSDEDPEQSDSKSEEEEEEWGIDWDDLECVDEYGDDRDRTTTKKLSEGASSEEEFDELELDAVDELNEVAGCREWRGREKERRSRSEDDKNESEEKEGDPWSRWVGVGNDQQKREEKKKEGSRERGHKREGVEMKREDARIEKKKPTLAELVLKGKMSEGVATRDKKSRVVGRSPSRRRSPPRKVPSPVRRSPSRKDSSRRRESPARRDERRRGVSPLRKRRSPSPARRPLASPPMRKERRPSPPRDRRRERSPRRIPSPSTERRRNPSPQRKERLPSPPRGVERPSSPCHGKVAKRERSPLIPKRYALPRISSPNRMTQRRSRSRSPVGVKREKRGTLPKVSSPNRVKIGKRSHVREESSPSREERRARSKTPILQSRKDLPSLLDVKIIPILSSRMEGRVKREEEKKEKKEEERPKERNGRDGTEEKKEEKRKEEETKEEKKEKKEKEEEKKRHIPIVWNEEESDVKKKYRSIGHVDGFELIGRKKEVKEEKKREGMDVAAKIPPSMIARVGKCDVDGMEKRWTVMPSKCEVGEGKSLESSSQRVPSIQNGRGKGSVESATPLLQPTEVVRIITNNDVLIGQSEQSKEPRGVRQSVREDGDNEEEEEEEESGWLSANLQEKKPVDVSSAALRLFGRATASALSSSTMRDAKPIVEMNGSGLSGEKGGKRMNAQKKRRLEGRIEMRSLQDTHAIASGRRRHRAKVGVKGKVSQAGPQRLLEAYF